MHCQAFANADIAVKKVQIRAVIVTESVFFIFFYSLIVCVFYQILMCKVGCMCMCADW